MKAKKDVAPEINENENVDQIQTNDVKENDNSQLIADATKKIDDLKAQLAAAKDELKKLTGKKSSEKKGPGVIGTIFTLVSDAGQSGISKPEILAKLVEMFPDRAEDGMNKTINVQLPSRMSKERGVTIKKLETGNFAIAK